MGRCHSGGIHIEMSGHLDGLQGQWSETPFLVERPDSGDIVACAACGREMAGEVGDVQADGDVWIREVEVGVIAEVDERLCL